MKRVISSINIFKAEKLSGALLIRKTFALKSNVSVLCLNIDLLHDFKKIPFFTLKARNAVNKFYFTYIGLWTETASSGWFCASHVDCIAFNWLRLLFSHMCLFFCLLFYITNRKFFALRLIAKMRICFYSAPPPEMCVKVLAEWVQWATVCSLFSSA